jgi:phosphoglycerate dehydrogenase-like enzyme
VKGGVVTVVVPATAPADLFDRDPAIRLVRATEHLPEAAFNAEVVVADRSTLDMLPPLDAFPRLRLVRALSSGVDGVLERVPVGVTLCNVGSGVHDASVAEWVVLVMLTSLRKREVPESLAGKRVLIIGYGTIGRALESRLQGFEVSITRVAAHTRPGVHSPEEIPSLLETDVVVLLAPATEATRSSVDAAFLCSLPDGALIVNAARGELVDQAALVVELSRRRLYAALDVTTPEPLPAEHPLCSAPNCIITPHVAGTTLGWEARAYAAVARQLERFRRGDPLENVRSDY